MSEVEVRDNRAQYRFEAHLDGQLAGFADYRLTDDTMVFTHTEVDPAFEGRGVGSALVSFAFDQLRAAGTHKAVAACSFVAAWAQRHPEYADVVA